MLVTGGTGLVGSHLLAALATDDRFEVHASSRPSSRLDLVAQLGERVSWKIGELNELSFVEACLADIDAVVHASGLVSYAKKDAQRLREVNVDLTALLADSALRMGVKHFIHVSSIAAISPARREDLIEESALAFHRYSDTSRYALSKNEAEREVWRAAEEGLGITILNPSVVLGLGRWQESSTQLIAWVAQGQRYYPSGGTGYVDARDVAAFAKTCLLAGASQRRYLLNAENWTFKQFFDEVAQGLGVAPPMQLAKPWQAGLAWRWAAIRAKLSGKEPLLTRESTQRAMLHLRYDNAASLAAGAHYSPLKDTIAELTAAYRHKP